MTTNRTRGKGSPYGRPFVFLISLSFLILLTGNLQGQEGLTTDGFQQETIKGFLRKLEFGNAFEVVDAAHFLGGTRNSRFIRPLGKALLKGMSEDGMPGFNENDPFVKTELAWALGRTENKSALPYLMDAFDRTVTGINEEVARKSAQEERYKSAGLPGVVLPLQKSGPALVKNENTFPASPDVYWDVADRFKSSSYVPGLESHEIQKNGYNVINQGTAILAGMGRIFQKNTLYFKSLGITQRDKGLLDRNVELLTGHLNTQVPEIRKGIVKTMGAIGTEPVMKTLTDQFETESDYTVKIAIARSILLNDKSRTKYFTYILDQLEAGDIEVRSESALALRDLGMGESVFAISAAIEVEEVEFIRRVLKEARYNASIDNIRPVNY